MSGVRWRESESESASKATNAFLSEDQILENTLIALDTLEDCVRHQIDLYEKTVAGKNDTERLQKAEASREWLDSSGKQILVELRAIIWRATTDQRRRMCNSLAGALLLKDVEQGRDMSILDNWDGLLGWAEEILPTMKHSFTMLYPPSGTCKLQAKSE